LIVAVNWALELLITFGGPVTVVGWPGGGLEEFAPPPAPPVVAPPVVVVAPVVAPPVVAPPVVAPPVVAPPVVAPPVGRV
jgi:hypothetical protein